MAKKRRKRSKETKTYYNVSKMTSTEKYHEICRILRGDYDNWKSFGYSGGLCSGR